MPQQVFAWRRKATVRNAGTAVPSFAGVMIEPVETGGMVELVISGVTMRIGATVPAARVTELVRAVRSA
jgi:hypothetical protein